MISALQTVHPSWIALVNACIDSKLKEFLTKAGRGEISVYPPPLSIFRAFSIPREKVRVVLLGQDPYPRAGHANGFAFAVPRGIEPLPYSLKLIFKEMQLSYPTEQSLRDQTLDYLAAQGILLLNSSLTVSPGEPDSHSEIWAHFTSQILRTMALTIYPVFIVLGAKARARFTGFPTDLVFTTLESAKMNEQDIQYKPVIAYAPHPAGDIYAGNSRPTFLGSRVFETTNELLKQKKQPTINF